jgi:hypothetical protein
MTIVTILRTQRHLESWLPASLFTRLRFGTLAASLAVLFSVFGTACQTEYKTVLDPLGPIPGGNDIW